MALDFDKYLASWLPKLTKKVHDNITKSSPVLYMMLKDDAPWNDGQGGDIFQPHIKYAHATNRGWYSGYDTLDITPQDTRTAAEFRKKQAYASIIFNGYEEASDKGELAVQKVVKQAYDDAQATLKDMMATALFETGAANAKQIVGLPAAIDDGTNTASYGNIDRTTNVWWKSQYDSGSQLAVAKMREIFTACARGGMKDSPDYIVCDLDTWNAYAALVDGKTTIQQPMGKIGEEFANLGFKQISFMGVPVVYDEYCPANTMYILNSNTIKLYADPSVKFKTTELTKPANMDAKVGQIKWFGNMVCTEPRANGKLVSLTYA
ncbi:phage major capsid protein [Paenibacillus sp. TRM 82003]|nr:phage major capsid protein [Paenibacillus sp. TRM 82003]